MTMLLKNVHNDLIHTAATIIGGFVEIRVYNLVVKVDCDSFFKKQDDNAHTKLRSNTYFGAKI